MMFKLFPNAGGYSISMNFPYGIGTNYPESGEQYFLERHGERIKIGTLGGTITRPAWLNDHGQVVGYSSLAGDAVTHAFLFDAGTMTDLGTLGGTSSVAYRVNNNGQVAGNSSIAGDQFQHAFFYGNGTMTDLGTLGGSSSYASGMNEHGAVVGSSLTGDGCSRAFLWNNGTMTDLGTLGGSLVNSYATDINSSGQVVGYCSSNSGLDCHAFLYCNGTMVDVNDLVDAPHMLFRSVQSIDDSGRIVVCGSQTIDWNLDSFYTCVLTPVPEPSSIAILAIAFAGIFSFLLCRKKSDTVSILK